MSTDLVLAHQRANVLETIVHDHISSFLSGREGESLRAAVLTSVHEWALEQAAALIERFTALEDQERLSDIAKACGLVETAKWAIRQQQAPDQRCFAADVERILRRVGDMLQAKNHDYGDSALTPLRIFSKAPAGEGIAVRIDDKLSRIKNLGFEGRGEDTLLDLIGYLVLLRIETERRKGTAL